MTFPFCSSATPFSRNRLRPSGLAYSVVASIEREQRQYSYDDVAIFYRTNAQSRILEDTLRRRRIPYRIYGSLRFYDRAEIKDVLAYFRLLLNEL